MCATYGTSALAGGAARCSYDALVDAAINSAMTDPVAAPDACYPYAATTYEHTHMRNRSSGSAGTATAFDRFNTSVDHQYEAVVSS